jgi:hypothetical protein
MSRLLLAAALLIGCSVPLDAKPVPATNRCEDTSACGPDSVCVESSCVATSTDLTDVIIEIAVPSTGGEAAGTTQHIALPQHVLAPGPQGLYKFEDLYLARPVLVTVGLAVEDLDPDCAHLIDATEAGHLPVRVELYPSFVGDDPEVQPVPLPPGIPREIYDATSDPAAETNQVQLNVPAGIYDVYITPLIPDDELGKPLCDVPPLLLTDEDYRSVQGGKEFLVEPVLDAVVPAGEVPNLIHGEISGPDLSNWTVDLIENKTGRRLSNPATLAITASETSYEFALPFWQAHDQEDVDVLVRLSPPESAAQEGKPVFFWRIESDDPDVDYPFDVSLLESAQAIAVSGNVVDESFNPVPSTITVQGTGVTVLEDFGANVLFRRTIDTDAQGNFQGLFMLPGADDELYTVIVRPADESLHAVTTETFDLDAGHQGGTTFHARSKRSLQGVGVTAQGAPASLVSAVVEPVSLSAGSFLQALKLPPILPGGASTFADNGGNFVLSVDVGEFNLWLRPDPESGFPWSVLTRLPVSDTTALPGLNLAISNPIVVIGQVRVPNASGIKDARIRAWAKLAGVEGTTGPTPGAIQIAESVSTEGGNFRLLLPASIRATLSQ